MRSLADEPDLLDLRRAALRDVATLVAIQRDPEVLTAEFQRVFGRAVDTENPYYDGEPRPFYATDRLGALFSAFVGITEGFLYLAESQGMDRLTVLSKIENEIDRRLDELEPRARNGR